MKKFSRQYLFAMIYGYALVSGCSNIIKSNQDYQMTPSLSVKVDGTRLNYERSGPPDDKTPTLIMVHGFGASLQSWHDVFPILSEDLSVLRLDLKGFGFSDKPNDHKYQPIVQAKLLAEFVNELPDEKVILVGHSYGGGIVLLAYLQLLEADNQDRIGGIVLIDAAVYQQEYPFFVASLRNPVTRFIVENFTSPKWRSRYVLERIVTDKAAISEERVNRYAYFLSLPDSMRALKDVAEQIDSTQGVYLERRLSDIDVPVLILWGAGDPVIPLEHGRRLLHDLTEAHLEILPTAGHVPHEEFPKETAKFILDFVHRLHQ